MAAESLLCLFMTGLARVFPGLFLWTLGLKYSGLDYEVFLLMAATSIGYFCGVLWVVHNARRFVYWWNGAAVIVLTLALQAYFICKVDLSTVRSVLILSLCTAFAGLAVNLSTGVYGFVWGPRKIPPTRPMAAGL